MWPKNYGGIDVQNWIFNSPFNLKISLKKYGETDPVNEILLLKRDK